MSHEADDGDGGCPCEDFEDEMGNGICWCGHAEDEHVPVGFFRRCLV